MKLLFTTFPVETETFLQREVRELRKAGRSFGLVSIWGGKEEWASMPVEKFAFVRLLTLFWWIPYWAVRKPQVMREMAERLFHKDIPPLLLYGETLMGLGYALCRARSLEKEASGALHLHAVWATMPATAAWFLHLLTGLPWSFGAHAYDIFLGGGDMFLEEKCRSACWVRTSTHMAAERLLKAGCPVQKLSVVRRGLETLPKVAAREKRSAEWRILAVGRLVPKMGFVRMIDWLAVLRQAGISFRFTLIGGGPQKLLIEAAVKRYGLCEQVDLRGSCDYAAVEDAYREHDWLFYAGTIARNGDRGGFPNVLGEAMAWGLIPFASPVGGVAEGIVDGKTGWIIRKTDDLLSAARALENPECSLQMRAAGRRWVEDEFQSGKNMEKWWRELVKVERQISCSLTGSV